MTTDMMTMTTESTSAGSKIDEVTEELRAMLSEIELGVLAAGYSLADAIREGCSVSDQKVGGWGDGKNACALTAAYIAAKARNLV